MNVGIRPAGTDSVTVTVPLVGAAPTLLATIEYVAPTCPRLKFPTWLFVIVMSGADPEMKFAVYVDGPVGATVWNMPPPSLQLRKTLEPCGENVPIVWFEPETQLKFCGEVNADPSTEICR